MESEHFQSDERERTEANEPRKLPIDWTESEWFSVWLRLARGEYKPVNAEAATVS